MHEDAGAATDPFPALIPREPFTALIFDCDGTLVDTVDAHGAAWRATFAEYGIRMTSDWYAERIPLTANDLIVDMARHAGVRLDPVEVHARQLTFYLGNLAM